MFRMSVLLSTLTVVGLTLGWSEMSEARARRCCRPARCCRQATPCCQPTAAAAAPCAPAVAAAPAPTPETHTSVRCRPARRVIRTVACCEAQAGQVEQAAGSYDAPTPQAGSAGSQPGALEAAPAPPKE